MKFVNKVTAAAAAKKTDKILQVTESINRIPFKRALERAGISIALTESVFHLFYHALTGNDKAKRNAENLKRHLDVYLQEKR